MAHETPIAIAEGSPLTLAALALAALALAAAVPAHAADPPGSLPRPAPVAPAPAASPANPRRRPATPPPLDGATYDYALTPQAAGSADRSYLGRAFVHRLAAADPARPLPLLVFIHGINPELIPYRWMGGGNEGDVRRIAAELMESGRTPPFLVAAPGAVVPAATAVARTSWPRFDLDRFLDLTADRLRGVATIDRSRVIVAGHSGGGCNATGGIATAVHASTPVHAALVIDVCMDPDVAVPLARARPTTHVVVAWQTLSWARRPFRDFERAFQRELAQHTPAPGVLRELEHLRPTEPMPHDAMVPLTLRRWLPPLLSPESLPDIPCVSP